MANQKLLDGDMACLDAVSLKIVSHSSKRTTLGNALGEDAVGFKEYISVEENHNSPLRVAFEAGPGWGCTTPVTTFSQSSPLSLSNTFAKTLTFHFSETGSHDKENSACIIAGHLTAQVYQV
nr:hypothetical protein [Skermanella pratensis]